MPYFDPYLILLYNCVFAVVEMCPLDWRLCPLPWKLFSLGILLGPLELLSEPESLSQPPALGAQDVCCVSFLPICQEIVIPGVKVLGYGACGAAVKDRRLHVGN